MQPLCSDDGCSQGCSISAFFGSRSKGVRFLAVLDVCSRKHEGFLLDTLDRLANDT